MQGLFARPEVKQRRLGQTGGTQVEVDPGRRAMAQVNDIDLDARALIPNPRPTPTRVNFNIDLGNEDALRQCVAPHGQHVAPLVVGYRQKKKTASQFAFPLSRFPISM